MSLETVTVEHLPASHKVHVALFRDVRNAAFLHQQLLGRNPDFEYAFIDASVIADAYRRYGISPSTKDLIVIKVTFPADNGAESLTHDQVWEHLKANVEGEASPVTDEQIATTSDVAKVRKYYKLNGLKWLDEIKDDNIRQREMESLVISAMALRGV
ncbi:hypothetical protein LRP88_12496 [Fusarium phalaenopsidis]